MRFASVLCLLSASLVIASPFQARDTADIAVVDEEGGSDVPSIIFDEEEGPALNVTDPVDIESEADNSDLEARKVVTNQKLKWTRNWNLKKIKVTGDQLIEFNQSGWVRFKTHFRNKGWWSYRYVVACAVRDDAGRPYTLSRTGKVVGKIRPFKSHTHTVDQSKYKEEVKKYWKDIVKGDKHMECRVQFANTISAAAVLKLVKSVISIVKKWGPVIASAIAIF